VFRPFPFLTEVFVYLRFKSRDAFSDIFGLSISALSPVDGLICVHSENCHNLGGSCDVSLQISCSSQPVELWIVIQSKCGTPVLTVRPFPLSLFIFVSAGLRSVF